MAEAIYDFRSDNVGGAAPEMIEAIVAANTGAAAPYGADDWTQRLAERASTVFERPVRVFPLACGTGSNSIALAALANPYGAIYCHESAHINVYECGASELFTGAKLVALRGPGYKLEAATLEDALTLAGRGNPTRVQPFALNITEPTDFGTLYAPEEVAALGCAPAELTWHAGVLARRLSAIPGVAVVAPVETNMIFLQLPPAATEALAPGPFHYYTLGREVRPVCRADQEPEGIDAVVRCATDALASAKVKVER